MHERRAERMNRKMERKSLFDKVCDNENIEYGEVE
jgi:hypothetical protein